MDKQKNDNLRFIGKVLNVTGKTKQGEEYQYKNVLIDNALPVNKDGSPNKYHQGRLLFEDNKTGKTYVIKQLQVKGVSEKAKQAGFSSSLCIDVTNEYDVQEVQ